jgi:putative glutamine amidotransferase
LVIIPARFSAGASALRYRAEVGARALLEAVFRAGGEPLLMHPHAPGGVADAVEVLGRLRIADAVLLPGGGDLDPRWAGQDPHPDQYDVDLEQDAFDLAVARHVLATELPLFAICRGTQAVNVALGGDLAQDMPDGDHRHRVHEIAACGPLAELIGPRATVSCYHHQGLRRLGGGLTVTARAADGVVEAVALPGRRAWFAGVQWHPEDTAAQDAAQAGLFAAFVAAAAPHSANGLDHTMGRRGR